MKIEIDDLTRPAIHALLNEHLRNMYELSPPESVHALDLDKLRQPDITFWTAWEGADLVGCGALKELDRTHGEVKSMRTPSNRRRVGAGRAILRHIIDVAKARSYARLSLETGAMEAFIPAQKLYESFGFTYCGPFGSYVEDPHSVFMTLRLQASMRPDVVPGADFASNLQDGSPAQPIAALECPLCGAPNLCAPARSGSFDTPCWCATTAVSAAALAALPASQRHRACLCPRCAAAAGGPPTRTPV